MSAAPGFRVWHSPRLQHVTTSRPWAVSLERDPSSRVLERYASESDAQAATWEVFGITEEQWKAMQECVELVDRYEPVIDRADDCYRYQREWGCGRCAPCRTHAALRTLGRRK